MEEDEIKAIISRIRKTHFVEHRDLVKFCDAYEKLNAMWNGLSDVKPNIHEVAIAAMQGMLSNPVLRVSFSTEQEVVAACYLYAKAFIEEGKNYE